MDRMELCMTMNIIKYFEQGYKNTALNLILFTSLKVTL